MEHEEQFLENEKELRLENDLLKIKMQAELGANFGGNAPGNLPPDIEQQFLQHILEFHRNLDSQINIPIREYLEYPVFPTAATQSPVTLASNWDKLQELLETKFLRINFLAEYPLELKYDFIITELFDCEIGIPMPRDMYTCFIYEEFHPNNDYDIRERTEDFLHAFFEGKFPGDHCWYLADQMVSPLGESIDRAALQSLLDRFHGLFSEIKDWDFKILETSWQKDDEVKDGMPRLGFSEGSLHYNVMLHDGHNMEIRGPFKLYMQHLHGTWEVFSLQLHGFDWASPATDDQGTLPTLPDE